MAKEIKMVSLESQKDLCIKGKVKWFSKEKGYGFIAGEDGTDYFVHKSSISAKKDERFLEGGEIVLFVPLKSEKGTSALYTFRNAVHEEVQNEA